jgi:hypothetical protein
MVEGIGPVNELRSRKRVVKEVRDPIVETKGPANSFLPRSR